MSKGQLAIKPALNQFNGGEISPQLEGRFDWNKYNYSSKLCKNLIPLIEGSLKRRGGSHFVNTVKEEVKFFCRIKISAGDNMPELLVNGREISLQKSETTYTSDYLYFYQGDKVTYQIRCLGYNDVDGEIDTEVAPGALVNITLTPVADKDVTLTIIPFSDAVTVKLNSVESKTIVVKEGQNVNWEISYSGISKTGTIILNNDAVYIIVLNEDELFLVRKNEAIISSSAALEGTLYLPAGRYKHIQVGGGAGALGSVGRYSTGGGGAGYSGTLKLPTGIYLYKIGLAGKNGTIVAGETISGEEYYGGDSYLKTNSNDNIVTTGGGQNGYPIYMNGNGGTVDVNDDYIEATNWALNGYRAGLTEGGASVYNGYGKGAGISETEGSLTAATNGFLSLIYLGA